jgi:nicotinamide-nucleotide amidase
LFDLAVRVGEALSRRGLMLVTAESCTGGWIGQCVTMVSGSSAWFERGFVTYTNVAKMEMLGVSPATLDKHGAVSEQTVREMAQGALARSRGDVAVAVSGVAGPTGGTAAKPVGTVCLAWAQREGATRSVTLHLDGDRDTVRRAAVVAALEGVLEQIAALPSPA